MKTLNTIYDYYRNKYLNAAGKEDKVDLNGIMIGIYLALSEVVYASTQTMHKDVGYYADLEQTVINALHRAYDKGELSE